MDVNEQLEKIKVAEEEVFKLVNEALSPDNECPENFACNICLGLVYDPKECDKCSQLFCN